MINNFLKKYIIDKNKMPIKINNIYVKYLSVCIIISFIITCLIALLPISTIEECKCGDVSYNSIHNDVIEKIHNQQQILAGHEHTSSKKQIADVTKNDDGSRLMMDHDNNNIVIDKPKKLALLIPFRDRFDELLHFAPHMTEFLNKQSIPHHIFILNQIDKYRFNRASLINAGFLYTQSHYDYIGMHDVDLLPLNDNLKYTYPKNGPLHIAAPTIHPKYHYETFVGGILLMRCEHFQLVNGMSNRYWGWGLEDDEFYVRLKDAKLKITRPINITTGIENTFVHIHDRSHRKRDTVKCFNQREITRKRDRETGLSTLKYTLNDIKEMTIDSAKVTVLNILLECDRQLTPWCDCNGNVT